MIDTGVGVEVHHHEVGTAGQCEIDMKYGPLVTMADQVQMYKYIVKNVAKAAWQDSYLYAQADLCRQWLRYACAPESLERWRAALRRRRICGHEPDGALLYRRDFEAYQLPCWPLSLRQPIPTAGWYRATKHLLWLLTRRAIVRRLFVSRCIRNRQRQSASNSAVPIRQPILTWPSPRC